MYWAQNIVRATPEYLHLKGLFVPKSDPFWHHHHIGNLLPCCSCEISSLFELVDDAGEDLRRVLRSHNIHPVTLEVNVVYRPVVSEHVLHHLQCCGMSKACLPFHHWGQKDWLHHRENPFLIFLSTAVYCLNRAWFCRNFSVMSACSCVVPIIRG